ncbi:MAG: rhomboid family intramembrane serine protease [Bacteroidota bacterium]
MATLRDWIQSPKPAVQQLIFLCVLVFVPALLLQLFRLDTPLYFLTYTPSVWYKPWSVLTYMFLHLSLWHLLGNLLWLYFVGSILEDLVGAKRIYWLFLGGGIAGAMVFQLVYSMSAYSDLQTPMQLLGASGGVSAVVIGTAVFTPRYKLFLFGLIEVELRWIAVVKVLLDLSGLASGSNIGGYTAHIGGMLWGAGYVYFTLKSSWPSLSIPFAVIFTKKSSRNTALRFEKGNKPLDSKKSLKKNGPSEAEVNAILDKISQVGYNNLSAKEKETLFKASKTD